MLGANGSWTWQTSSGTLLEEIGQRARDVHRQRGAAAARQRRLQRLADRAGAAARRRRASSSDAAPARTSRRPSRTSCGRGRRRDDQHAVPARGELVAHARARASLTSCGRSHAYGRDLGDREAARARWARGYESEPAGTTTARRWAGRRSAERGAARPWLRPSAAAFLRRPCAARAALGLVLFGPPLPAYLAMNVSVSLRASSSGRWFFGDFMRYELGPSSWPADAVVQRELAQAHGVDDDARRVRRVPDLELHLDVQRHVAEGLALDADVRPLAVGEPRHVVRRADVDVVLGQRRGP